MLNWAAHVETLGGMAMGQEDKFPLWPGSVELAQQLMTHLVSRSSSSK